MLQILFRVGLATRMATVSTPPLTGSPPLASMDRTAAGSTPPLPGGSPLPSGLRRMARRELLDLAQERGVAVHQTMTREEILNALHRLRRPRDPGMPALNWKSRNQLLEIATTYGLDLSLMKTSEIKDVLYDLKPEALVPDVQTRETPSSSSTKATDLV